MLHKNSSRSPTGRAAARRLSLVVLAAVLVPGWAYAGDAWRFELTPYLWFAGLKGDVATIPGSPTVPIDISSRQAVEDAEATLMVAFDARRGRHGVVVDIVYTDVRSDAELLPDPINLVLRSTSKNTLVSVAYRYELLGRDDRSLGVLAGGRYWSVETTLKFQGGTGILAGRTISHDESWVDPAVGLAGWLPLGDSRFYFRGVAAVGGFGVGSDLFYDLGANVGFQWNKSIGTSLGYRLLDVDYEDGDFLYDVKQQGWQIALTWSF